MRQPVVIIQCWWRTIVARKICVIEKIYQEQEILEYWKHQGINNAPQYAQDLFAGMATSRH